MYAALWRVLPGPWWARLIIVVLIVAVVLVALIVWVFPWVDNFITSQEVTVGQS